MKSVLVNNPLTRFCRYAFHGIVMLLLGMSFATGVYAEGELIPDPPNPPRLYVDLSASGNFLSPSEQEQINRKLYQFDDSTSNQILVVIVDDLKGMDAWEYATELGQKWGVGNAKKDNGVVVLICTGAVDGIRKLSIAVGYGLEGAIPDLRAKQVEEEIMKPKLRNKDYFGAINDGVDALMAMAKGEYNDPLVKKTKGKPTFWIILIIVLIIYFLSRRNKGGGMTIGPRGTSIFGGWGGGWGGNWGGGGSWGGNSGGGFGGFGGGGFGGGGASSDW